MGPILMEIKFTGARVLGWYNSALVKPELKSLQPAATSTVPSINSVAGWTWRAVAKLPVTLKVPLAGS